jgi:shikimate kinase
MNVVLIGFRGSGKSTVGRELAARMKAEFIDCDELIEKRTGVSIAELFEKQGESHFRTLESQLIIELAALDGKVIATGGGAVLKYQNMQCFKRAGAKVYFLDVGAQTAFRRIQGDAENRSRRPALTPKDPFTEVREQIELRRSYYLNGADATVPVDERPVEGIVKEILGHLGIKEEEPPPGDRHEPDPARI